MGATINNESKTTGPPLTSWLSFVMCSCEADLLALVCGVSLWSCHLTIGIQGQVWCLIVSIPDLCPLSYLDQKAALATGGLNTCY